MGFVRRAVRAVTSIFKPPKVQTPTPVEPPPVTGAQGGAGDNKSAAQIAEEEDNKRKQAIVAANAQGNAPNTLGDTTEANVTRKNRLGL